jgi:hypothetical protein
MASTGEGREGGYPRWRRDAKSFLYPDDTDHVMSVASDASSTLSAPPPVETHNLLDLHVSINEWDALPDGGLIVIRKGEEEDEIARFDVVAGWDGELRGMMGKGRGYRKN